MSHHSGIIDALEIWCYVAGILWPLTWIFSSKRVLTDAEKWAIAQEIIQQPAVMPDGKLQRAELVWRAYDGPLTAEGHPRPLAPAIRVGGRELTH